MVLVNLTEQEFLDKVEEMREWFIQQANKDVDLTIPKSIEYGSVDTINIGKSLISIFSGAMEKEISDRAAFEAGVFFFIKGKMARWEAALRRGEPVSDDTLFDMTIYLRMVQRVREVGGWPFADSFNHAVRVSTLNLGTTAPGQGVRVEDANTPRKTPLLGNKK